MSRCSPNPWQGRAFGLALLFTRLAGWNLDAFRHALERLDRTAYLAEGYFGRWLNATELMLIESAHFQGENPQHLYTVRFDSHELWGADAESFALTIEMFESYLDRAG
jgi:Nitrile hydratase beta subunit